MTLFNGQDEIKKTVRGHRMLFRSAKGADQPEDLNADDNIKIYFK